MTKRIENSGELLEYRGEARNERVVKDTERYFTRYLKNILVVNESKKTGRRKWIITEKRLPMISNIVGFAVQSALEKEEFNLVGEEKEKELAIFREKIAEAKQDLEYIRKEVEEKVDEEIKYG